MRSPRKFAVSALAFGLLATPAHAGSAIGPTAIGNFGDLAGPGGQAFKIEITASYGSPLGTITIWKSKGKAPRVQYYNPANARRLEALLPNQAWDALAAKAQSFHSPAVRTATDDQANLCMHPGLIRIDEIAGDGRGNTTLGDYCNPDSAAQFGDLAMQAAMAALPGCAAIQSRTPDRPILELQACTLLKGNLRTAGAAMNWLHSRRFKLGEDWAHWALEDLLNDTVVAAWGRHPQMRGKAQIKPAIYADFSGADLTIVWIRGLDARRALVEVVIQTPPPDGNGPARRTALNLTLERGQDGNFSLTRIAPR